MRNRTIIGDVRGCLDELDALLKKVSFTGGRDRLVLAGERPVVERTRGRWMAPRGKTSSRGLTFKVCKFLDMNLQGHYFSALKVQSQEIPTMPQPRKIIVAKRENKLSRIKTQLSTINKAIDELVTDLEKPHVDEPAGAKLALKTAKKYKRGLATALAA